MTKPALAETTRFSQPDITVRSFGLAAYQPIWHAMRDYTNVRTSISLDMVWYGEHPPVYTLGLAGKKHHLLNTADIPVVQTDRGGQVTYHGPGQLLVYLLLDLKRHALKVKQYVSLLEQTVIDYLDSVAIAATRRPSAPGVYVDGAKIAAIGIRMKRQCAYHGFALNVNLDLSPYQGINPCGYQDLAVTSLDKLGVELNIEQSFQSLYPYLLRNLATYLLPSVNNHV